MSEKKLMILLGVLLVICASGIFYLTTYQHAGQSQNKGSTKTVKTASSVGGPFEMIDHNGEAVTEEAYAGSYKIMFFGFTHCPGICPGELTKISDVLDILQEKGLEENITPLFITIDPERDTPDVMKDYVETYDKRIIGLTGNAAQVAEMKDAYKIYASKVEMEMMGEGNYMMDHSTYTYLMSPDNELLLVFDMQDRAEQIAAEIKDVL